MNTRPLTYRSFVVSLCAALVVLLSANVAFAHSPTVVKSTPAAGAELDRPPSNVTVQFSEELNTQDSTLKVFDASGKQVDNGDGKVALDDADHATMRVNLPDALPGGEYHVRWHVVLEDGDATGGEFKFSVAAAQSAPVEQAALKQTSPSNSLSPLAIASLVVGVVIVIGAATVLVLQRRTAR